MQSPKFYIQGPGMFGAGWAVGQHRFCNVVYPCIWLGIGQTGDRVSIPCCGWSECRM